MGLEAICTCRIDDTVADAKALLESRELILRTPFKRTFVIAALTNIGIEGDELRFSATAATWAKKMLTPAPSLASKLGLGHTNMAYVIGEVSDATLAEALDGHVAPAKAAKLSVAIVGSADEMDAALALHAALPKGSHIWVIHGKGPNSAFGDSAVRSHLRALGYHDSKSSAVSDALSATRYALG